ncbi:hypothetical protein O181_036905 [Austropuccinia psidii MF-1]|uniref:Uncharacterized protein n=1 Tax=Austropuccinia psidii MF-1 TaxID=1389203 RepID=A0A9Q3D7A5_9BASI|nr:hypothetical protein [Austropuccinia psidii MF-1]
MASGHILPSLASLANFHLRNPQAWGVLSVFQGSKDPLATIRPLGPTPYIRGVWAKWPFWALEAPYSLYGSWAIIHSPQSAVHGPFRPLLDKSNEAKGGSPLVFKVRWGPPEPVFDHGLQSTNFGQEIKGPNFQPRTTCGPFAAMASGSPRGHHLSSNPLFPSTQGEEFPFLHAPCTQGCRSGAYMVLYTIMHHFCS